MWARGSGNEPLADGECSGGRARRHIEFVEQLRNVGVGRSIGDKEGFGNLFIGFARRE